MSRLASRLDRFHARVKELTQQNRAPGLSIAVRQGEDVWVSAAGIANLATGLPVRPETRFLIGSNTKVMTATLVMQLVDAGQLDLSAPVTTYLPELQLAVEGVERVTVRHLLNHSSGIQGDYFADFGRGDDAIARYVTSLKKLDFVHETGRIVSYCNAGWMILGRILETVHGKPFHQLARDELFGPAGIIEVSQFAEESILGHCAVGHVSDSGGGLRVTDQYLSPAAMAPAGSSFNMTARELTRFGQLHIDGGRALDGTRLLSESGVQAMQSPSMPRTNFAFPDASVGLGWMLYSNGRHRVLTHGGESTGQYSEFFVLPDEGLSFVGLTNGPAGSQAARQVLAEIAAELVGLEPTPKPVAPDIAPALDLSKFTGEYASMFMRVAVQLDEGRLCIRSLPLGEAPADAPARPATELVPIDDTFFVARLLNAAEPMAVAFIEKDEDGVPEFFTLGRALRRVAAA